MAREEGQEVHLGFLWGHLSEKDQFEDLTVDRGIIFKIYLKKLSRRLYTGFI
jgi:hypothetical protein